MAGNENGTFKKCVFGAIGTLLVLWLSWASLSISTLNTKSAVTDAQYSYIQNSLSKIENMLTEHLKEGRK